MNDFSVKRIVIVAAAVLLAAGAATAATPGARFETRMVYDTTVDRMVMFGGATALDAGTRLTYDLGDTWEYNGQRWLERFFDVNPPKRSSHVMVFDTNRLRTVMFGGKSGTSYLNDTWSYAGGQWTQINTPNAPTGRYLSGAAFDPIRDRVVMYGGTVPSADGKTLDLSYETWEFDGTTWRQIGGKGPEVAKPVLVYDRDHNQVLMLGTDLSNVSHMYTYDAGAGAWVELKPANLPACVNEGELAYDTTRDVVFFTGGSCTNSSQLDESYEWSGTDWTKITLLSPAPRLLGAALAYDAAHKDMVLFGGFATTPVATTYLYQDSAWLSTGYSSPVPRSLFAFASDPENQKIWLFGGLDSGQEYNDFWSYQNGSFQLASTAGGPSAGCTSPIAAFDTNRHRLVLFCGSGATWEYEPSASTPWENRTAISKVLPPIRRFASMVYDENLKKIVLFGGYNTNYLDDTWTWDGSQWTRVKKNPPPSRGLTSMWYDPILKRTVIYAGIGRITSEDRISRYNDMWSFDGSGWAEIKPATLPGTRYGAQTAVDPRSGHTILFGGLLLTGSTGAEVQSYANDTWDWDGTTWKKLTTNGVPPARENGGLAFDYGNNQLVMFSGYGGYYLSDIWTFDQNTWRPKTDSVTRRRATR